MASSPHEILIAPDRRWWRIHWNEIWEYRDLLRMLVLRDIAVRYRQTILGPLWHVIQPLLTTAMYVVVFGIIAGLPTDGAPRILFYLSGVLVWNAFSSTLNTSANSFLSNAHLFGKVYFPRLVSPLAAGVGNLVSTAIQIGLLLVVMVVMICLGKWEFPWATWWHFPLALLVLLHALLLGLGVGLWFASFSAKYRDLTYLLGFLTQLWMYATPVIYPAGQMASKAPWLLWLNPMAPVAEAGRWAFLGTPAPAPGPWITSIIISLLLVHTGTLLFQRTERTFVDVV